MENWHAIWERKGEELGSQACGDDQLFKANGYDTPLGSLSEQSRSQLMRNIISALRIQRETRLLDVGCGSGAVLSLLRVTEARFTGVDYSAALVEVARRHVVGAEFRQAEARKLPFEDELFDAVLCNGVFLYFSDLDYANAALEEMVRICRIGGRIFVTDVPDLAKKQSCLEARRRANASVVPEHLYYAKTFFTEFAAKHSLVVTLSEQTVNGYANAPFRFNALFEKPDSVSS